MSNESTKDNEAFFAETDYELGQDNMQPMGLELHNPVFFITSVGIAIFVLLAIIFPDTMASTLGATRTWLESTFDWVFMGAANIFVIVCLVMLLSPLGRIRLGGPNAKPEFSLAGWLGMLFAAGMGIGLMFFGVLEPVYHFQNPPLGVDADNVEAARAMGIAATIYHWGLHPWAIYGVVAVALAFFSYNAGLPLTIRSAFFPLFGDRVWGWLGHVIDTLAVFATMFGLATSLGFGAQQAAGGLEYLYGIEASNTLLVVLIMGITGLALVSVLLGIHGGVKRLSALNMILFAALGIFVLVAGSTLDILASAVSTTGSYLANIIPLSNWFGREDTGFMHGWTTFYWAWWISWSPFVGMFIARVSYGRTVREFIFFVLIIPTLAAILWMNIMGGYAIDQFLNDGYEGVVNLVTEYQPELTIYAMLEVLPLASITSALAIFLVIVFFVTSSDSGSIVIDTISAGGLTDAPVVQRAFWVLFEGLVAIVLLLGGGLAALQAASIGLGFPFTFVLLTMAGCTLYAMRKELPQYQTA